MILNVNLTTGKIVKEKLPPGYREKYLGGNGYGAVELYKHLNERPLIFAAGGMCGTVIPTSAGTGVFGISPLTGFLGESYFRGQFGPEMMFAGYEVIRIVGESKKPVFLLIEEDVAEIQDASRIWGKDTWQTEDWLKKEFGPRIETATIGVAGENKVKFACITHDYGRQAGRTGMGCLMGQKKLKAIAVHGDGAVKTANDKKLFDMIIDMDKTAVGEGTEKYRVYGTPGGLKHLNSVGALPTRNWQQGSFDKAGRITGEEMKHYWKHDISCFSCPIACGKLTSSRKYKVREEGPEYETIYSLGSNTGIGDFDTIIESNELCDILGMDTITTGNLVALAFELGERGIIKDKELKFGNSRKQIALIKEIAYRKGLGRYMADGIVPFAKRYKALKYAVQVKGMEPGGFHPNGLPAYALSIAVDVRGADHQRAGAYGIDLAFCDEQRFAIKGKARQVKEAEDYYTLFDSFGLCKFARKIYNTERMAELWSLVTGKKETASGLKKKAAAIYDIEKAINVKLGWTIDDDSLPDRVLSLPLPDEPVKGRYIKKKDFETMRSEYYKARRWKNGIPKVRL
jgi:aldehyde:ferredoxin oxidoreductase